MEVLEQFKHAESFAQMALGDKLIATMYVIILGMGITFVALVLIWGLTALMSRVLRSINIEPKKPVAKAPVTPKVEPAQTIVKNEVQEDETELVAVISAAIAAAMGTSIHKIIVTNIKRIPDATPTWGQVGRSEVMAARTH